MLTKQPEMLQSDAFSEHVIACHNAAKCDCVRGSALDPACGRGAYGALPELLTGFNGYWGREAREGVGTGETTILIPSHLLEQSYAPDSANGQTDEISLDLTPIVDGRNEIKQTQAVQRKFTQPQHEMYDVPIIPSLQESA